MVAVGIVARARSEAIEVKVGKQTVVKGAEVWLERIDWLIQHSEGTTALARKAEGIAMR